MNRKIMAALIPIAILIVAVVIGLASDRYLGHDNPIEEASERVINDVIEDALNLPRGSLDSKIIDLSPDD